MPQQESPRSRAEKAIEELHAQDLAVTARAVRDLAGVSMAVATESARIFNEEQTRKLEPPQISPALLRRFKAVWGEAFAAAREEFTAEREAWSAKADATNQVAERQREESLETKEELEQLRTRVKEEAARHEHTRQQLAQFRADNEELTREIAILKERVELVSGERDRLNALLKDLSKK